MEVGAATNGNQNAVSPVVQEQPEEVKNDHAQTTITKADQDEFGDPFNDDFSDSDSDPVFNINAQSAANAAAQSTSCWDGVVSMFSSCFSQKTSTLDIDGKKYKIRKLIAEGGFSFVYLGEPAGSSKRNSRQRQFAIKKMIIQTKEQMKQARWEIHVMQQLQAQHTQSLKHDLDGVQANGAEKSQLLSKESKEIARKYKGNQNFVVGLVDSTVCRHEKIPEFKIVYMVFPFFERGNLVSVLQRLYDQNIHFMEEKRIFTIFIKICFGVHELHKRKPSWAHRDIKLDNILLGPDDEPYLMDFGSVGEANVTIRSRKDAVKIQEWAQKNMSGPYTPPEFFNCPSKFKYDCRTDVWALGCLLYAMAFGRSPFDNETGSSALAVLSKVEYPETHPYSAQYIQLIEWMLKTKLKHRPFVPSIIQRVHDILNETNDIKTIANKKD